jgi:Flp pilus assembly protein TadG
VKRDERGSASIWAILVIAGAFTVLLGLVVDGGRIIDERVAASRAAAQAARAGADALSVASVRNGSDAIDAEAARARAQTYLRDAGMDGTVSVAGDRVTVSVTGESKNQILGVIGVASFPIDETASARAITEEDSP